MSWCGRAKQWQQEALLRAGARLEHGQAAHEQRVVRRDAKFKLVHGLPQVGAELREGHFGHAARERRTEHACTARPSVLMHTLGMHLTWGQGRDVHCFIHVILHRPCVVPGSLLKDDVKALCMADRR